MVFSLVKAADVLRLLMDEVPRTIPEIANGLGVSTTHALDLCKRMGEDGAIHLRKSGGTWVAWRKTVDSSPREIEESVRGRTECLVNQREN